MAKRRDTTLNRAPARDELSQTKQFDSENVEVLNDRKTSPLDAGTPRPWRIGLYLLEKRVQIVFDLTDTILIGRSNADGVPIKGLDLTSYGAYESGLSRRHARLSLQETFVVLEDLDSSNGTFINRQRLKPNLIYRLRNGDVLGFAMMEAKIQFLMNPFVLS